MLKDAIYVTKNFVINAIIKLETMIIEQVNIEALLMLVVILITSVIDTCLLYFTT